jgi:hypothetical protein
MQGLRDRFLLAPVVLNLALQRNDGLQLRCAHIGRWRLSMRLVSDRASVTASTHAALLRKAGCDQLACNHWSAASEARCYGGDRLLTNFCYPRERHQMILRLLHPVRDWRVVPGLFSGFNPPHSVSRLRAAAEQRHWPRWRGDSVLAGHF